MNVPARPGSTSIARALVQGRIAVSPSLLDARILIVDDDPTNVRSLTRILNRAGYQRITCTTDPSEAVARFSSMEPDLLLLDLHMPEMDGVAVMERLRSEIPASEYFPILILTGDGSREACQRALATGATDFVTKPIDVYEVLLRIRNLLETRSLHREVAQQNRKLETKVRERTAELEAAQLDTIERLAIAAEFRDDETGQHTHRVGALSKILARSLGWSEAQATLLGRAAPLHDVGKIGIPDAILRKPGPLSHEELAIMRTHPTIGARILSGGRSEFIQLAEHIAHFHHERWDGAGYPEGLIGEATPAAARLVAVADFFDAMTHDRVYRKAWPVDQVFAEIATMGGSAFDPAIVAVCERPAVQNTMQAVVKSRSIPEAGHLP